MRNLAINFDGTEELWEDWEEIDLLQPGAARELQNFEGNRQVAFYDKDFDYMALLVKYLRNSTLIMDDLTLFADARLSEPIEHFLTRKKQFGVDLIGTCQGFMECPQQFIKKATRYVIFNPDDHPAERKKLLKNYNEVVEKYNRVIQRSKTNRHAFEIVNIKSTLTYDEQQRYAEFIIVFGSSMTGKTRFVKELVTHPQLITA